MDLPSGPSVGDQIFLRMKLLLMENPLPAEAPFRLIVVWNSTHSCKSNIFSQETSLDTTYETIYTHIFVYIKYINIMYTKKVSLSRLLF